MKKLLLITFMSATVLGSTQNPKRQSGRKKLQIASLDARYNSAFYLANTPNSRQVAELKAQREKEERAADLQRATSFEAKQKDERKESKSPSLSPSSTSTTPPSPSLLPNTSGNPAVVPLSLSQSASPSQSQDTSNEVTVPTGFKPKHTITFSDANAVLAFAVLSSSSQGIQATTTSSLSSSSTSSKPSSSTSSSTLPSNKKGMVTKLELGPKVDKNGRPVIYYTGLTSPRGSLKFAKAKEAAKSSSKKDETDKKPICRCCPIFGYMVKKSE